MPKSDVIPLKYDEEHLGDKSVIDITNDVLYFLKDVPLYDACRILQATIDRLDEPSGTVGELFNL